MYDPLVSSRQSRLLYARLFQPFTQQYDLTQPEIDILLFLYQNKQLNTARDIAARRGLAKSNVSTAIDSLRQKGYVRVEDDPGSRRIRRLFLAEDKQPVLEALQECQKQFFLSQLAGFTEEEKETLFRLLSRMADNIARELCRLENGEE